MVGVKNQVQSHASKNLEHDAGSPNISPTSSMRHTTIKLKGSKPFGNGPFSLKEKPTTANRGWGQAVR